MQKQESHDFRRGSVKVHSTSKLLSGQTRMNALSGIVPESSVRVPMVLMKSRCIGNYARLLTSG